MTAAAGTPTKQHRAPHQFPAGQPVMFGEFKLIRTVGEGEFGKVKLAVDSVSNEEVAIKLLKKDRIATPARRAKVMREISMLNALDHPYIVSLKKVVETDAYIGLVMEYAAGGEMFHYIMAQPDGRLREEEGRRFFAQLVSGVSYIHSVGIVHRDLKLENLLLGLNNNILISDFGFANRNSEHMETSCGSPGYAAPELVISNGYVGDAADIWSCGVILYGMLCGYLPYDDDPANPESENINLLYQYILSTKLAYPSHLSSLARNIIGLMLVPDPKRRAKMSEVMGHTWLAPEAHIFQEELVRRLKQFGYSKEEDSTGLGSSPPTRKSPDSSKPVEGKVPVRRRSTVSHSDERTSVSMQRSGSSARAWLWGGKKSGSGSVTPTTLTSPTESIAPSNSSTIDTAPGRTSTSYSLSNSDYGGVRERVLRVHSGPADKNAMSSRDPLELLMDLENVFEQKLGWIVQSNGSASGEYKLRVLKPRGVMVGPSKIPADADGTLAPDVAKEHVVDPKMNQIVESLPISLIKRVRNLVYTLGPGASKGYDGKSLGSDTGLRGMEEEMTFSVEVQKLKDLKGMHVVEFRRVKGDIWGFKRLYTTIILEMPL
ncbi:kinase-like domain-containing protein [Chytriomyces sp. MP71]|nr:kinase-like domain-containing protein [Chytriomyces sp. MP71]